MKKQIEAVEAALKSGKESKKVMHIVKPNLQIWGMHFLELERAAKSLLREINRRRKK